MLIKKNVFEINRELYTKYFMEIIQKSPLQIDQSVLDLGAVTCSLTFKNQGYQHALEFYPGARDTGAFRQGTRSNRPKTLVMWDWYNEEEPIVQELDKLNQSQPIEATLKDGVFMFILGQRLFEVSFQTTRLIPQPEYFYSRFRMKTSKSLKQSTVNRLLHNYYVQTDSRGFLNDAFNAHFIQYMNNIGLPFVGATVTINNYPTMELSYALEKGILKQVF